jgi:hypothetical protein
LSRHRTSLFGSGRPVPLDREGKVRVQHLARCLSRHTAPGEGYGSGITAKVLDVLHELLWTFHNARTGLCFPSYERIAEAAGCARSTVAAAIQALERAHVISWVNRLKRVRGDNGIVRVIRSSNGYQLKDPKPAVIAKSESRRGTTSQVLSPSLAPAAPIAGTPPPASRWATLRAELA